MTVGLTKANVRYIEKEKESLDMRNIYKIITHFTGEKNKYLGLRGTKNYMNEGIKVLQ